MIDDTFIQNLDEFYDLWLDYRFALSQDEIGVYHLQKYGNDFAKIKNRLFYIIKEFKRIKKMEAFEKSLI